MAENEVPLEPKLSTERYRMLRAMLSIDLLNLDDEVSKISALVQDAAETAALAYELRDSARDNLKVQEARGASRLRNEPFNGKTRSEAQIESETPITPEYQKALEQYSDARLDAALWATVADGMQNKSLSLRSATDLIKAGYLTQDFILNKRRKEQRQAAGKEPPEKF